MLSINFRRGKNWSILKRIIKEVTEQFYKQFNLKLTIYRMSTNAIANELIKRYMHVKTPPPTTIPTFELTMRMNHLLICYTDLKWADRANMWGRESESEREATTAAIHIIDILLVALHNFDYIHLIRSYLCECKRQCLFVFFCDDSGHCNGSSGCLAYISSWMWIRERVFF